MTKTSALALGLAILPGCLFKAGLKPFAPSQRPVVAVAGFDLSPSAKRYGDQVITLADSMTADLLATKRFRLVERRKLRKILQELKLEAAGLVDTEKASRLGKLTGAHYVLAGTILHVDVEEKKNNAVLAVQTSRVATVEAEVRLIEVETGYIVASVKEESRGRSGKQTALFVKQGSLRPPEELVAEALKDLAGKLADSLAREVDPL